MRFRDALPATMVPPALGRVFFNTLLGHSEDAIRTDARRFAPALALVLAGCSTQSGAAVAADAGASTQGGALFNTGIGAQCPDAARAVSVEAGSTSKDAAVCLPGRHVSYAADVVPIFAAGCAVAEACHQGSWDGVGAYRFLVGVPAAECCDGRLRVEPGHPEHSYLIEKLRGVDLCGGQKMPLKGSITDAELGVLEDWICEGAPHD